MFWKNDKKVEIDIDEVNIDELLSRSIANILPDKEGLKKELLSGRRLRIYIGADATGPDLHLGHSTNLFFMERMRRLGHEVIILFGDFTAMIGDPTDKDATRVRLTKEQVNENIKTWKKQIAHVLDTDNKDNPVRFEKNSKWLSKLDFGEIVNIASNFTVQQMIERDMFDTRLKGGKPIYLHEFLYPLMVAYDSLVLDVDIELGGNDQTFNMLGGRTLQKNVSGKNKFVVATTLLENPNTGKKLMSKSEGGYVSLQDKPSDMYGKIMALPDEVIIPLFIDATWISLKQIDGLKTRVMSGPKELKMELAREIVTIYHDKEIALATEKDFQQTFSGGGVPEDIEEVSARSGELLVDLLVFRGIVSSRGDFKRLQKEGAIKIDGERIDDIQTKLEKDVTVKIGKRRFVKVVIE